MTAAPVPSPRGESNSSSGRSATLIHLSRSRRSTSRVVSTASTSRKPELLTSGTPHSYFFAVHGITETQKMSFGSMLCVLANHVFVTAPNICCGDLAVDSCGTISGYSSFKKRTQPGQHEVKSGRRNSHECFIL